MAAGVRCISINGRNDGHMTTEPITPVETFGGWWAKREDYAGYTTRDAPSGAKVRQYAAMIDAAPPGTALIVGCSADSAMQVYVAHAGEARGRRAVIVVPARRQRSAATAWAAAHGATIDEVRPGYPSVYRSRARGYALALGGAVRWDRDYAARDTAAQVVNLPAAARRIVIPTGSGLTAVGVIGGLIAAEREDVTVVCVAVSGMATAADIGAGVARVFGVTYHGIAVDIIAPNSPYGRPGRPDAALPDGTPLDPFYAAKALQYVADGDVFWVSGRRPGLTNAPIMPHDVATHTR
jgi:1-aminocyclopropane-1-carboxylate deaminase/D-cysteine desulfhydrase-like pyridoxal-dependent ACC family enzyme